MTKRQQVQQFQIRYEVIGKGPLLFLLHGWANTWEAWLPVIPMLSDHYTLIIPDLPGFGESEGPALGWTTAEYATWLAAFIKDISIAQHKENKPYMLAGHSFGGKIAAVFAASLPDAHLSKLILIDASGIPDIVKGKRKMLQLATKLLPRSIKKSLSNTLRSRVYKAFNAETDYVHANSAQRATLAKILPENISSLLPLISQPTLLIWGTQEKFPPLEHGRQFNHLIPSSLLVTFDTGHFPHHTHASEVATAIIDFLAS